MLCPGNEQESVPAIVERATFRFDEPGTAQFMGCSNTTIDALPILSMKRTRLAAIAVIQIRQLSLTERPWYEPMSGKHGNGVSS